MTDIVERLRAALLDRDNFPYMDSEVRVRVGLARDAADEIERLSHDLARAVENHTKDLVRLEEAEALLREMVQWVPSRSIGGELHHKYAAYCADASIARVLGSKP